MKTYKVKINTPYYGKGEFIKVEDNLEISFGCHKQISPRNYPDIFEEIKESLKDENGNILNEGDILCIVRKDRFKLMREHKNELHTIIVTNQTELNLDEAAYFKTEQGALDWIDKNKPIYSKKQIYGWVNDIFEDYGINCNSGELKDIIVEIKNDFLKNLKYPKINNQFKK